LAGAAQTLLPGSLKCRRQAFWNDAEQRLQLATLAQHEWLVGSFERLVEHGPEQAAIYQWGIAWQYEQASVARSRQSGANACQWARKCVVVIAYQPVCVFGIGVVIAIAGDQQVVGYRARSVT